MEVLLTLLVFLIDILIAQLILLVILVFQVFNGVRKSVAHENRQPSKPCSGRRIKSVRALSGRLSGGLRGRNMPTCVYLEEPSSGNRFRAALNKAVVVGRSVAGSPLMNDLPVSTSSYVSRKHLLMFEQNGNVYAENLSGSGTMVNGRWINGTVCVNPGDLFRLGDVCLRVTAVGTCR